MTVNVYSKDREAVVKSDVISLHCPLTEENTEMIDREFIEQRNREQYSSIQQEEVLLMKGLWRKR